MFERILVTLDGSAGAEIVIPYAEEIASNLGSVVTLANVYEQRDTDNETICAYMDRMTGVVQQHLLVRGVSADIKVINTVLEGKPAEEILRYADENNISLIAMASLGASTRGPWLLGNIAAKVIRVTGKPVLLIKTPAADEADKLQGLINKILLPLDGSELGEAAIPYAEKLASALNAEIVLLQFVAVTVMETMSSNAIMEQEKALKTAAIIYLNNMATRLKDKGLNVSIAVDEGLGSAANHIIDFAEANGIDLIAMSTHGRSGISRWVFGSITDKVLHSGNTPVLAVRTTPSE
jgi:nucleotide-binding universal stress UspA family protein